MYMYTRIRHLASQYDTLRLNNQQRYGIRFSLHRIRKVKDPFAPSIYLFASVRSHRVRSPINMFLWYNIPFGIAVSSEWQ